VADHQGRIPDLVVPFLRPDPNAERLRERIGDVKGLSETDRTELLQLVDAMPSDELPPAPVPWDLHGVERLEADPQLTAALGELKK
jgi:hypothetical protein